MQGRMVCYFGKNMKTVQLWTVVFCWVLFSSFLSEEDNDKILLTVNDRAITKSEFQYYFRKNYHDSVYHGLDSFLGQYINMQLKVTQAIEAQTDRNISFISELTKYRNQLASPYLTHKEKEEELSREAYERLLYEVSTSHILVKIGLEDTLLAYNRAILLRTKVLKGEPFEKVALDFSDDPHAKANSGNLGYFSAFQTDYNFETAVFKMNPGELSMPVRSRLGYHIIKCHEKRRNQDFKDAIPPYYEVRDKIIEWIKKDSDPRSEIIHEAFIERLKKEWNFSENPVAVKTLFSVENQSFNSCTEINHPNVDPLQILCSIDEKEITMGDFFRYVSEQDTNSFELPAKFNLPIFYKQFVADRLITYEKYKLEDKYPEFRFQFREYRNAMLLLAITNREVWQRSISDSLGIVEFHKNNNKKYRYDTKADHQKPEVETFSEIQKVALSDYQDMLMQSWLDELHKRYKVCINQDVFSSVKESFTDKMLIE